MSTPHYQRRHYEQLARLVASMRVDTPTIYSHAYCQELEDKLTAMFTRDNPQFRPEQFRAACWISVRPAERE